MPKRSSMKPGRPKTEGSAAETWEAAGAEEKNPAAVALGRRGGLKGGKARAAALSADERSAIARKAAQARWKRPKKAKGPKPR